MFINILYMHLNQGKKGGEGDYQKKYPLPQCKNKGYSMGINKNDTFSGSQEGRQYNCYC